MGSKIWPLSWSVITRSYICACRLWIRELVNSYWINRFDLDVLCEKIGGPKKNERAWSGRTGGTGTPFRPGLLPEEKWSTHRHHHTHAQKHAPSCLMTVAGAPIRGFTYLGKMKPSLCFGCVWPFGIQNFRSESFRIQGRRIRSKAESPMTYGPVQMVSCHSTISNRPTRNTQIGFEKGHISGEKTAWR